ncbi:hypothetical protein Q9233_014913 [Columba guinea]|nr:hypothetical protein Q9233_014913 [Columba guinea]
MSQTGEESSSSSDTESEIENEQLICTLAPTVYSRDEGSIDVAASPAFQCLDEKSSYGQKLHFGEYFYFRLLEYFFYRFSVVVEFLVCQQVAYAYYKMASPPIPP